jgi:Fe-S cluster assembly ATP-binding protein
MLKLENVSFSAQTENGKSVEIIDNINLEIDDGDFVVITGPNGGGKSTLARLIMGIEQPTSGRIYYKGIDITNLPVNERAALGIGYAFQQPARFKGLTVRSLISLAHGSELPENECCSYLTRVGLCSMDYLNREVDTSLSGGEVKRIEIATLMARDLGLAIFDEPEAGIDLWSFSMLVESFKQMAKAGDKTIIIISHQERLMSIADEIIVIADGKLTKRGPSSEIFTELIGEFNKGCSFRGENDEEN